MRVFTSVPSIDWLFACVVVSGYTWPSNHSAREGYATIVLLRWHGNKGHTEKLVRGGELVLDNSPRHEIGSICVF